MRVKTLPNKSLKRKQVEEELFKRQFKRWAQKVERNKETRKM